MRAFFEHTHSEIGHPQNRNAGTHALAALYSSSISA